MPTGVAKYPYPQPTAVPDVPADLLLLTQRLALMNGAGIGYVADAAALTATITNSDAYTGLHVYHAAADCVVRYNGAAFKLTGKKTFADAAAQTTWTSTYSGLLETGSMSYRTDTGIDDRWNGSAWKAWDSDWITYTPTLTNVTLGTGSVTEYRYQYTNGTVRVDFSIRLGTGGLFSGGPTMTLPVTATALRYNAMTYDGVASAQNAANNVYPISVAANAAMTTQVQFFSTNTGAYAAVSATVPHTWALNSVLQGKFRYEPA